MTILALDLGTNTGWASVINDGRVFSGVQSFKPGRFDSSGMRYLRFEKWLNEIFESLGNIDLIYYEEVRRHMGVDAAHIYGGLLSHLQAWATKKEIPYSGIPVGTIKKHATGKGNASKDEMKAYASKLMGRAINDDNEADAIAILNCGKAQKLI